MTARVLVLMCALVLALAAAGNRPADRFSIGDLVEVTTGMGLQVAEIAAGPDSMNYYFAAITGVGPKPYAAGKLKLLERADAGPNAVGPGDVIQFHAGNNTYERGVVQNSVGAYCQVKGNGIAGWVDCKSARVLQRAASRPPAQTAAKFEAGEGLQVRVGEYWMKGAAAKYDPGTNWYAIVYDDGGQKYVGWASAAVLRKGPGLQLPGAAAQQAAARPAGVAPTVAVAQPMAPAAAMNPPVCGGRPGCAEVNPFAATMIDFRVTAIGRDRLLTATVRFQNKNPQPLILGFVADGGVALDDQGNRYVIAGESAVRGIGLITRNSIDPKFVLQPGEASDGRFELVWRPATGREVFGTSFTLDLTLREIQPLAGNQYQLGREHAIRFTGLGGAAPTAPAAPAPPVTSAAPQQPPPAPMPDACGGKPRCYSAGIFSAEIVSATGSQAAPGTHHVVRFNVRFRNVTNQPLILAYKGGTSSATDNLGNPYYWGRPGTHDTSFQGIGLIGRTIDPSFTLQPGESRNATFTVVRFNPPRNSILGSGFTYDVVIGQVELMTNGQQVRVAREYSLNFQNVGLSGAMAGPASAPSAQSVSEAARKIGDLFRKK